MVTPSPDGHAVPNQDGVSRAHVDDRSVLDVGLGTYGYGRLVRPDHGVVPNGALLSQGRVSDDVGARRDAYGGVKAGHGDSLLWLIADTFASFQGYEQMPSRLQACSGVMQTGEKCSSMARS